MSERGYDALIKALEIFKTYVEEDSYEYKHPTGCEHDTLYIYVRPEKVSEEDKEKLDKLGFFPATELEAFKSYKYGSA